MSEQTNPEGSQRPQEPSRPMSLHDFGKRMSSFVPGQPQPEPEDDDGDLDPAAEQEADELDDELDEVEYTDSDEGDDELDVDEGEDADAEDEDPSDEPYMVLTVNGQKVPVADATEAQSLAQKGLHYTQSMQEFREEQRAWEQEQESLKAQVRQREDQYAAALDTLKNTFGAVLGEEPDWNALYQENPEQYAHMRAQWDQLSAIRAEQERIQTERQKEIQKKQQQWAQQQADQLRAQRPEWSDPEVKQRDFRLIQEYAESIGASTEDLHNIMDHRLWLALHDAARYRQAQKNGTQKAKSAKTKTASPGSGKKVNAGARKMRKKRKQLQETGSDRVLGEILNDTIFADRR